VAALILAGSAVGGITLTANAHHPPASHAGHTGQVQLTMRGAKQAGQPTAAPAMTQTAGTTPAVTPTQTATPTPTATGMPVAAATQTPA